MDKKFFPFGIVIVTAAICYVSFNWAMEALIHSRGVVEVPDVTGKSVTEALSVLSQSHLGLVKEGEQYDKQVPAGVIVRQIPAAPMKVREGRLIRVVVSQGGETLFVPNVVGQPLRNAQTVLQNGTLSVGEIERRPSLRFEKDQVMSTDPPAGAIISKNALVNLVLSDGSPGSGTLLAPDFIGKSAEEARRWTSDNHVLLSVREENDLTRPGGEVLMQSPSADSPIHSGDTLTLVINSGSLSAGAGAHVHYEVPSDGTDRDVRVSIIDEGGEREVFRKSQAPGSTVDLSVPVKGRGRARIFVNGILTQEQPIP